MVIKSAYLAGSVDIDVLSRELSQYGVIKLRNYFIEEHLNTLAAECVRIYSAFKKRKDFLMPFTENTPRHMFVVSEDVITEQSQFIHDFYYNEDLLKFLTAIAGSHVHPIPWYGERYLLNGLENEGDTHGWHWDDYSYALVMIAKTPKIGGQLSCIPNSNCSLEYSDMEKVINSQDIQVYNFEEGEIYFMRSSITLHRVESIGKDSHRLSLAISYGNDADLTKQIDHGTIIKLYQE